jgi:hypothetical protein
MEFWKAMSKQGRCLLPGLHSSTRFVGSHQAMFLAVVVVITFVSIPLICSWQSFVPPLQATAFERASASAQSIVPASASPLAASEKGGFASLVWSDVSEDTSEDERAFYASMVLGMLCFFGFLARDPTRLVAEGEGSAKPYYCLYRSVLERPG